MKQKLLPLILIGACISTPSYSQSETKLHLSTGIDNNPYRFSKQFQDDIALYFDNRLRYKKQFDFGMFFVADFRTVSFEKVFDDASRKSNRFSLGYQYDFNKNHRLKGAISSGDYDKTYVSRSTGEIGTSQDQEIGNRYDYDWTGASLDYRFRINKQHRLYAEFDYIERDYDDYTSFGLSDLDYEQTAFKLRWRFRPNKDWLVRLEYQAKEREYLGKSDVDAQGTAVADNLLNYSNSRVNGFVSYQLTENHSIEVYARSETRDDNFEGYYNTDYTRNGVRWRWKIEDYGTLVHDINVRDQTSTTQISEDEFEEDYSSYDYTGNSLIVSYLYDIWENEDYKIDGYIRLTHNDFEAVQDIYTYERQRLEFGVDFKF